MKKWIKRKGIPADKSRLYLKWMLRISAVGEPGKLKAELKAFLDGVNEGKIEIEKEVLNIQCWLENKLKAIR